MSTSGSRTVTAVTTVVALIMLAGCTNTSKVTPSPTSTPAPSPAATAKPTASATPTPTTGVAGRAPQSVFRAIDPNPLAMIGGGVAAAWSGTRFIVAGFVGDALSPTIIPASFSGSMQPSPPGSGHRYDAASSPHAPQPRYAPVWIWTSPDGQTWSTTGATDAGLPRAYAFDGAAGVAVGSGERGGAVWRSPDDRTWTLLPEPKALLPSGSEVDLTLGDVTHGPAGYVAIGSVTLCPAGGCSNPTRPVVFWSQDGDAWHRELMGAFGSAVLQDIVELDGRYVIAGQAAGTRFPTVWTSADGRAWTKEAPVDGSAGGALSMAAEPGEALLTVVRAGGCAAWRTADGLAWTQIVGGCPLGQLSSAPIAGPSDFVASEPGGPTAADCQLTYTPPDLYFCAALVEISATGQAWTSLRAPTPTGKVLAASANEVLWTGTQLGARYKGLWLADISPGGR